MNQFELDLLKFSSEAEEIQKAQAELATKSQIFSDKFQGFLKQYGLPDNFTLPQLALLSIRQART